MQATKYTNNKWAIFLNMVELTYHSAVRDQRTSSGGAAIGILSNLTQVVTMMGMFYLMFEIIGFRTVPVRGDYALYLLTGIFLFLLHNKAVTVTSGAAVLNSPMLLHRPMNTVVSLVSRMISSLYLQIVTLAIVVFVIHTLHKPVEFYNVKGFMAMFFLAWGTGVAIGFLLLGLKPFFPQAVGLARTIYTRLNMIASGKMFLAGALPSFMLPFFDWNPLFHVIDQARAFTFQNYYSNVTNIAYPVKIMIVCVILGTIGEYVGRKRLSRGDE